MLRVNAVMIYIIHKILVLLKIIKNSKRFLRSIIDFHFLKRNSQFFLKHIMMENSSPEKNKNLEENIIKDVGIFFRLKKLKK